MGLIIRKAAISDIKTIHAMLLSGASGGVLLSRSLSNLYNHVRDFHVLCDEDNSVLGCVSLAIIWENLAEVRSLFLHDSLRGKGYGRNLVATGIEAATLLGVCRVFTLTYSTEFFSRLGFLEVTKDSLPHKVWSDCVHCPKFPDCDEVAMAMNIDLEAES